MRQAIELFHEEDPFGHSHEAVMVFDIMMPIVIEFDFTPHDTDPDTKVVWTVSRDMIVDAVLKRKPGGVGDVKLRVQVTERGPMMVMEMTGWNDAMTLQQNSMVLMTPLTTVENYLRKTLTIRPQHVEDLIIGKQIDRFLADLLR